MKKNIADNEGWSHPELKPRPKYVPAKIVTYTSEEILEEIGPAQTCSPDPCPAGD